jgi:hypothetical protein
MLQATRLRVLVLMRLMNFLDLYNPSSLSMAPEYTRPLTENNTRSRKEIIIGSRARLARKADKLAAICEPNV